MRYLLPLFFATALFSVIFLIPLWVDPDGTGIFNSVCGSGRSEVPTVSTWVLSLLPCSITAWKLFHLGLIIVIVFLFQRHYPLSLLGWVGFFPVFLLTLEDDLLAFPLIFLYWGSLNLMQPFLLSKQAVSGLGLLERLRLDSQYRLMLFLGVLLFAFLGLFVWKGSLLIGLILLSYFIHPGLSVIPSLVYLVAGGLNNWGGSSEAVIGAGFVTGLLGLVLVFFNHYRNGFSWRKEYWLVLSFGVLSFFQPKWGEWMILPLAVVLRPLVNDLPIRFFGYWMLVIIVLFTVFTSFPTESEIVVIHEAVSYQGAGHSVLTDWGVGHYFEYYGGIASQAGGYIGEQQVVGSYWLGPDRDCDTISSANALFFQQC